MKKVILKNYENVEVVKGFPVSIFVDTEGGTYCYHGTTDNVIIDCLKKLGEAKEVEVAPEKKPFKTECAYIKNKRNAKKAPKDTPTKIVKECSSPEEVIEMLTNFLNDLEE